MSRVFMSYASPDSDFAAELSRALVQRGAEIFDSHRDLKPSNDVWNSLIARLRKSDLVVFVVPRHEGQGKSALAEVGAAKALGTRVVGVLPDRVRAANNDVVPTLGYTYSLDAVGKNVGTLADQLLSDLAAA